MGVFQAGQQPDGIMLAGQAVAKIMAGTGSGAEKIWPLPAVWTHVVPEGTRSITVPSGAEFISYGGWGGGGGGSGGDGSISRTGTGGSAAAPRNFHPLPVSPGVSVSVRSGAGGAGGAKEKSGSTGSSTSATLSEVLGKTSASLSTPGGAGGSGYAGGGGGNAVSYPRIDGTTFSGGSGGGNNSDGQAPGGGGGPGTGGVFGNANAGRKGGGGVSHVVLYNQAWYDEQMASRGFPPNIPLAAIDELLDHAENTPIVIVLVGSSTMEGVGATTHGGYPYRLQAMLASHRPGLATFGRETRIDTTSVSRPTSPGLHFYNGAVGGRQSSNYIEAARLSVIEGLGPDLIIHMVGSNDIDPERSGWDYRNNLIDTVERLPSTYNLFVHTYPRPDLPSKHYLWPSYWQALKTMSMWPGHRMAGAVNVADDMESLGVPGDDPLGLIAPDGIHTNNEGQRHLAEFTRRRIGLDDRHGELILRWYAQQGQGIVVDQSGREGSDPTLRGSAGVISQVNGKWSAIFNGTNSALDFDWGRTHGLPITIITAFSRLATGDISARPFYSRTGSHNLGYPYAAYSRSGSTYTIQAATNAFQFGPSTTFTPPGGADQPCIIAITHHVDGSAEIYAHTTTPFRTTPTSQDAPMGPWITSMRYASNNGLGTFATHSIIESAVYAGALTAQEVSDKMSALASDHSIPPPTP